MTTTDDAITADSDPDAGGSASEGRSSKTGPDSRPAEAQAYTHKQIVAIMSGLMLGLLLAVLDQTIVTTALTRISEDFHRTDLYSWVVTSYLLTSTATTPLYGKISDLYGRKRIFQFAIVIFLIGSILSGLSQNMYQLIAFRAVQGVGAGGLASLAMAIVGDVIPPRDRGRYQGYFGVVFGASSVLGPLIGGFLVDQASWRWVFYVNVPIGAVALVVINRTLKLDHVKRNAKIDYLGSLMLVGGVSLLLLAVQNVGTEARIDGWSWVLGIIGAVLVVVFVFYERRVPEPILPLSLFHNEVFRITSVVSLMMGGVMFGALIFLPQYMQVVRGISPTVSGLRLLPLLAGLLITSIGSGQFVSRGVGYKRFIVSGTVLVAIGSVLLTQIGVGSSFWGISGSMFVIGAGLGFFLQTSIVATQNAVRQDQMGTATAGITFVRTLGGAIGASALGAVLIEHERATAPHLIAKYGATTGQLHAFVAGMDRAYLWSVPVAVLAVIVSLFVREVALRTTNAVTPPEDMGVHEEAALSG